MFRLRIIKMFVVVRSLNICLLIKLYEYLTNHQVFDLRENNVLQLLIWGLKGTVPRVDNRAKARLSKLFC